MKTIYTTCIAAAALGMFSAGSAVAPAADAAEVDGPKVSGMSRYGARNAPLRRASKSCPPW